jgi:nucleoside 2-deoxyribosyltransferase
MKKIYLAIPYSGIEEVSYNAANEVAALLIAEGFCVFSPISHSHPIWKAGIGVVEHSWEVWMEQDKEFVQWCDTVYVIELVNLNGVGLIYKSKGVMQEIDWAKEFNKELKMIKYNTETKQLEL